MTFKTTKLRDAITFALAAGATTLAGTGVAFAQEATEGQEATTLDRIEVTGSRIKRTDIETSQPIFTLDRDEIQAQGLTSIGDVIQNITAQGSALNSTFNNGGNGETQVSLRNLGSQRTLVLVNGKRWVGGTGLGGAIDLNTIPTAAVERIEVLKDGASTIYGSDAIAGVVNIILRQNYDGAEANAYLGTYDKGDGFRQSYDFTVGSAGERWSAMFGVGYVKEEPVFAGDREISAVPVFGSTPNFGGSSTRPDGNFCITQPVTLPNGDPSVGCFQPGPVPGTVGEYGFFIPTGTGTFRQNQGSIDSYNFAPDNYLLTPQERRSIFASGTLDITDNLRFKALAQYNERVSEQLLAANPIVLGFPVGDSTVISADSVFNPYGVDIDWIQYRPNESGGRSFNQDVDTTVFDLALEGTFDIADKPFDWEVGYTYGQNQANNITQGLFQISKIQQGLGPSFRDAQGNAVCGTPTAPIAGCVPINILSGLNSMTPEMLDFISFTAKDAFEYKLDNYYANIGGDLFDLPGGPFAFSFGIESRRESGFDEPDALIDGGDTTGNARTATRGSFSVDEAYLELAIPVLADVPFAKLLDFSVATRYSDYSNFGNTTNSKFGFRWRPFDDLMFRGNWSEGFRAPSISELFTGQGDSFPQVNDPCAGTIQGEPNDDLGEFCDGSGFGPPAPPYNQSNSQIRITVGGNPDLGPETSTSKTLGFVYSPSWAEGLEFTLDWWEIEIDTAIVTQGGQGVLDGCYRNNIQANCDVITRDATGAISDLVAIPRNIGTFSTEGYDFTVFYRMPETAYGKFSFVWDTAYLVNAYTDVNGDGTFSEDPVSGEGGNQIGEYFGTGANNWRIRSNLQARWELGDFGATWLVRYYSDQDEVCQVPASQRNLLCSDPDRFTNLDGDDLDTDPDGFVRRAENDLPERFYNDVSAYWKTPWNAKVTIGVNNLFDEDPPVAPTAFANSFDPAYDLPGQFYYLSYNQRF